MINTNGNDDAHEQFKALGKSLRTSIDSLKDAKIYYVNDPSDRNRELIRRAQARVDAAEEAKQTFLEAQDEDWPC